MKKVLLASLLAFNLSSVVKAESLQLTTGNTVVFRGVVDGGSITDAMLKLSELSRTRGKASYPIYLVLDSPGGSIDAGLSFIEYAKTLPNVQTVSIFAASMASGIVEALPGKRYVTNQGVLMFHRARGSLQGQFEEGELESELAFFKSIVLGMEKTNAARIGISIQDYKSKVMNEWWLCGQQAIGANAADAVVDLQCSQELVDSRTTLSAETIFGSYKLVFSGCPLFRAPLPQEKEEE